MKKTHSDVAIVGAGIVGLALAREARRRGFTVTVLERAEKSMGASIRNFGMIWPVGQPAGSLYQQALRSRDQWLAVAHEAELWHECCGSVHVGCRPDEMAVLEEFVSKGNSAGVECSLLSRDEVIQLCPGVNPKQLVGGMWSPSEICVDPREVMQRLPEFLEHTGCVDIRYGTAVTHVSSGLVRTASGEDIIARWILVCSGSDFASLFPEVMADSSMKPCKLQMLRTVAQPEQWRQGPMLAGGLTLQHYGAFRICETLGPLRERIQNETPELNELGIHVMASQHQLGEVTLGDSHEYGDAIPWTDQPRIEELILRELRRWLHLPDWTIQERWTGIYAKHPSKSEFVFSPTPGVTIVNGLGGAGMTRSFGLAEDLWNQWLGTSMTQG